MKNRICFPVILFLFSHYMYAQTHTLVTVGLPVGLSYNAPNKEIEGTPFLADEWKSGEVILKNGTAYKLDLKYNIYTNEVLFLSEQKEYKIPSNSQVAVLKIEESIFHYDSLSRGFYQIVSEGKRASLLKKYTCRIEKGQPDNGMIPTTRDNFKLSVSYYAKDNILSSIKELRPKKNEILKLMSDQSLAVEEFIKRKNLNAKNEIDLIMIFDYYNTIQ